MPHPAIVSWLDENWQTVECQFYGGIQQGALSAAYTSAFTGKFPLALGLAGISYAAGWTAEQVGCNYRPPESDNEPAIGGCMKIGQGFGELRYNRTDYDAPGPVVATTVKEITRVEEEYQAPIAKWNWRVFYLTPVPGGGLAEMSYKFPKESTRFPIATLTPYADATCEIPAPDAGPGEHNPGDPIADPINHVIGSCNWTIQATDSYVDDQLRMHTYYTITARDETCGGPFAYWSSDKGPQWVAPDPPAPPDAPDGPLPPLPPPDYNPRFDDIDDDLDKVKDELEKLKECACPEEEPIEGEFRTISFRSDETSPFGKSRLRKRLRYRSRSGIELGALVDHWKDFSWESGPVRVQHLGASWGAPSVWAASIDEGKRVLLHAAGEAGIDPNQVGRWKIGSSNNSRIGVSDTMRVDTTGGYYWITDRDGSDQRPVVKRV